MEYEVSAKFAGIQCVRSFKEKMNKDKKVKNLIHNSSF